MEFPQDIWDVILSYVGFMIDATLHLPTNGSMYGITGMIQYYGQIAVGPKHLLKVLKFMHANNENMYVEPKVWTRFYEKYNLGKTERAYDRNDYLYHYWSKNPSYFFDIDGPYDLKYMNDAEYVARTLSCEDTRSDFERHLNYVKLYSDE